MLRAFRQIFAIVGRLQRIQQPDRHGHDAVMAENSPEIDHAGLTAVPADDLSMLAIIDGDRTNFYMRRGRGDRFKKRRAKLEQVPSASGGSLRKDG